MNHHYWKLLVAIIIVLLLVIFWPRQRRDDLPVRQSQEIRESGTSDDETAVEAIEEKLK